MSAIAGLDSHAVDPKTLGLDRLQKGIVRLELCRLELAKADSSFHDSVAVLGEHPSFENPMTREPQPQLQHYASNSPEVMLPDPQVRKEKERLYHEAFKAASEVDLALSEMLICFAREMDAHSEEKQGLALQGTLSVMELVQEVIPSSPRYRALCAA
jgi:hypothetical protein